MISNKSILKNKSLKSQCALKVINNQAGLLMDKALFIIVMMVLLGILVFGV